MLILLVGCGDDDSSSGNVGVTAPDVAAGLPPNGGKFLPSTTDLDFDFKGGTQKQLTFHNSSKTEISVGVPKITGQGAERFSIDEGCANTNLPAAGTCLITVKRGGPSNIRLLGATLTVPSNVGDAEVTLED